MSSGYGFFYNLASMMGPIVGGVMFDAFGYRKTLDYNMCFEVVIVVIFATLNCGIKVF